MCRKPLRFQAAGAFGGWSAKTVYPRRCDALASVGGSKPSAGGRSVTRCRPDVRWQLACKSVDDGLILVAIGKAGGEGHVVLVSSTAVTPRISPGRPGELARIALVNLRSSRAGLEPQRTLSRLPGFPRARLHRAGHDFIGAVCAHISILTRPPFHLGGRVSRRTAHFDAIQVVVFSRPRYPPVGGTRTSGSGLRGDGNRGGRRPRGRGAIFRRPAGEHHSRACPSDLRRNAKPVILTCRERSGSWWSYPRPRRLDKVRRLQPGDFLFGAARLSRPATRTASRNRHPAANRADPSPAAPAIAYCSSIVASSTGWSLGFSARYPSTYIRPR